MLVYMLLPAPEEESQARSARGFIAVCDSAREKRNIHKSGAPRSGAAGRLAAYTTWRLMPWHNPAFRALARTAINA